MGDHNLQYTPEEALSTIGFGNFQALVLAYAGLGLMSEAMEMMILSFVGIAIQSEWEISPGEESLLTTVLFIGMLFGAYVWGLISDAYGRRKGFLGATIMVAVSAICSAFSPNYKLLLMFRCLLGFGIGGGHTFNTWFVEFVPTSNRGAWQLILCGSWTFGSVFEALLAWIIMPRLGWRWVISLSCVPSFFVLVLYGLTTESPRYLATKGRIAESQKILEKVAFTNRAQLPLGVLVCDKANKIQEENSTSLGTPLLPLAREKNGHLETFLSSFLALFSSKLRRTTLLLWVLYFGMIFLYYGVVLLTSELSSGQSSCNSTSSLLEYVTDGSLYRDVLINALAEVPGFILAVIIADRIGRKLSIEIMSTFGFILLLPLVVHQNKTVTTALLFGSRMFICSSYNITGLYSREVYPTSVRATGAGTANSMGRIGGMICPLVAVGLLRGCHQTAAIVLFEAVTILSVSCAFYLPFETSGRGLNDTLPSLED